MKKLPILTLVLCALGLALPTSALAAKGAKKAGKGDKTERREKAKIIREYDKNSDGKIDGDEKDALRKAFETDKSATMKSLDSNSNGKLDDSEIDALKVHAKGGKGAAKGKAKGAKQKKNA